MWQRWQRLSGQSRRRAWRIDSGFPSETELLEDRTLLAGSPVADVPGLTANPHDYATDSILVRYRDDNPHAPAAPSANSGTNFFTDVPGLRIVHLGQGVTVADAVADYRSDPNVLYAEPNYRVSVQQIPDDPQFDAQWGMNNTGQTGGTVDADIDAAEAWDYTTGHGNTLVAVIDTGVDYTHEDLAQNIWVNPGEIPGDGIDNDNNGFVDDIHGYNFAYDNGNPMDDHDHGTHVAGIIGAVGDNGIGVAGVNWNVKIMAVKFLDSSGSGSISDAIQGIYYAVNNGAQISNNSWGLNGAYSQALQDALQYARDAGHIFVAAAGNGNSAGVGQNNDVIPFWPANHDLDNVVSVAALDDNDQIASFSNYGATSVDVGAPGVHILSTTIGNTYKTFSGTSMATPHVTGLLSLIWDQHPDWNWQQVLDRFYETLEPVDSLEGITVTGSKINAAAAVGPDVTGPQLKFTDPSGFIFDPISSIRVQASEALDPANFGPENILSFVGPNGEIPVTDVIPVPGERNRIFEIQFPVQDVMGPYRLTLGGGITDMAGNLLDQDRDGIGGEAVDDTFDAAFDLVPFFSKLDFGTSSSPVQQGFQRVDPSTTYTAERGFGWTAGTIDSRDRGENSGDDLQRDFNYATGSAEFAVDVPAEPAVYDVTITLGDGSTGTGPRDDMGLFIEGQQLATVTTNPGQYVVKTFQVTVSDGQFNLRLEDQGGSDPLVLLNGLVVEAEGPDLVGPRVIKSVPSTETSGPLDRFTITFDEPVDPNSFTTADVVALAGPSGAVTPTEVREVAPTIFEILFSPQTELGEYSLTIGPDIRDLAGNPMDQDQDRVNGEPLEDLYSTSAVLVPIQPFDMQYDFGVYNSPVAAGYVQVLPNTTYNSTQGFGWVSGAIDGRDRGATTGDDATRDFNHTALGTFVVDVPSDAVYNVTITMGDGLGYVRDDMGVFLEGELVDSVTADGTEYAVRTYQVRVTDGQLTLTWDDLGGDPLVMINSLHVATAPPDTNGPQVVGLEPTEALGTLDQIVVVFNETIDATTFTPGDVVSLAGPDQNEIPVTGIEQLTGTKFAIDFDEQTAVGTYTVVLGPEIRDLVGNRMDQDGDGTDAEVPDDQYTGTITLSPRPPFEAHLDFGTTNSPVAAGYSQVLKNTSYNAQAGYGWLSGAVDSRDRGGANGDDATRDFNYTQLATFGVDVPEASSYQVTLTMGDGLGYVRDDMGIFLEGTFVDSVTADGVNYAVRTYTVTVTDGQLTLHLDDLGGDPLVMINSLDILEVGPDTTGPQVVNVDPSNEIPESLDRFTVTFDETIDSATFTLDDVMDIQGPNGSIAPTAVNAISGSQFEIVFAPQTTPGDYMLTIGPDIADLAGNNMDQDGDGITGENPGDLFQTTATLVPRSPFVGLYDFGTATSPVAAGYTQVLKTSAYSASAGFGWLSGSGVDNRDRGASTGDDLTRDFNYTQYGTFVVDVPAAGDYEVTITMGDGLGYVRDNMGIFLEGQQVDSVTTDGVSYAVRTYTVTVTDGQLTLLLDDLGGSNPLVMINALEVREVVQTMALSTSSVSDGSTQTDGTNAAAGPVSSNDFGLPQPQADPIGWMERLDADESFNSAPPQKLNATRAISPLIEHVFSQHWPRIVEQLEQLGDSALGSSI